MEIAEILVECKNIFAWSSADLGVVPCEIAEHKWGIPEGAKLVFQEKIAFVKEQ